MKNQQKDRKTRKTRKTLRRKYKGSGPGHSTDSSYKTSLDKLSQTNRPTRRTPQQTTRRNPISIRPPIKNKQDDLPDYEAYREAGLTFGGKRKRKNKSHKNR